MLYTRILLSDVGFRVNGIASTAPLVAAAIPAELLPLLLIQLWPLLLLRFPSLLAGIPDSSRPFFLHIGVLFLF